jgi:uncharacterized protein (DUF1015 family)
VADVRPFFAVRYQELLDPVVAPPWDVLSEEDVARYRARSPHNVVHLTRPGEDYEGAAALLDRWLADGVLVEDPEPAMYLHETEVEGRGSRLDLIAALRLVPYEDRIVLPHERTQPGAKQDRLALLRATGTCLEPLWFLADGLRPLLECAPAGEETVFWHDGRRHRLRRVPAGHWTEAVHAALADSPMLIADGHHRYETTLAVSRELGGPADAASRFTLALVTDVADPGLVVLPTHRLLRSGIAVTGGVPQASLDATLAALRGQVAAGVYRSGQFQVLPLEGEVAVVELHRQVIDNILGRRDPEQHLAYTRDPEEAVRWVDSGQGVAAFFLDAPDMTRVLEIAKRGGFLPPKSTYFHPKPPSGMMFHRLEVGRRL